MQLLLISYHRTAARNETQTARNSHFGLRSCNGNSTCNKHRAACTSSCLWSVNRTRFDDGEYGIAVRWLARLPEDPELRTFELEGDSEEFVINSTELRCTQIELIPDRPVRAPVRRSARARKHACSGHPATTTLQGRYTLPTETEQVILRACW